jgi:hypothetical protein
MDANTMDGILMVVLFGATFLVEPIFRRLGCSDKGITVAVLLLGPFALLLLPLLLLPDPIGQSGHVIWSALDPDKQTGPPPISN